MSNNNIIEMDPDNELVKDSMDIDGHVCMAIMDELEQIKGKEFDKEKREACIDSVYKLITDIYSLSNGAIDQLFLLSFAVVNLLINIGYGLEFSKMQMELHKILEDE